MRTERFAATLASLVLGFGATMAEPPAVADEVASPPMVLPTAIEIDKATLKIDVAAHVRSIDESLRRATVTRIAKDGVKVAAADARTRG